MIKLIDTRRLLWAGNSDEKIRSATIAIKYGDYFYCFDGSGLFVGKVLVHTDTGISLNLLNGYAVSAVSFLTSNDVIEIYWENKDSSSGIKVLKSMDDVTAILKQITMIAARSGERLGGYYNVRGTQDGIRYRQMICFFRTDINVENIVKEF